ncbi:NPCBM/NEW2 domain-containing protein [Kitasatospora terrestris]|uniref:Alpha-galactosidase n=1 Tax=Kitasatospora terrestris TaxID=258051 RepID=A0ABP9DBY4_9ACTN
MAPVPRVRRHRAVGFTTALALLGSGATLSAAAVVGLQVATATPAAALQNSLALTPQMGFNNWNSTGCRPEFNEAMVKGTADLFVAQGLKDAGYTYVNIDDCWALPQRDAAGNLVPDPVRFPNGIKAVADYVHDKGLKFGIYSSAGTKTCDRIGFPGGLGHEQQDANLWASWGVDYLKYDSCNGNGIERYKVMGEALRATGRNILYGICEWGTTRPWAWAKDVGSSWRTTGDISDSWSVMLTIAHANQPLAPFAGPGSWNDPDMLEVGNGHMTDTEYRTHFSLWAEMAAPLLIGTDLRKATPETYAILKNTDVIAVDQDPLGRQGSVIAKSGGLVVMSKPLADGSRAITLTNETTTTAAITTSAEAAGIGGAPSYTLKDLWSKETTTSNGTISATVPAHGTVMYRVTPSLRTDMPAGTYQLGDLAWSAAHTTRGPVERDHSAGGPAAGDGGPLTIGGATYPKGLGVRPESDLHYYLGSTCTGLTVDVGIDDESPAGSAIFRIYRDSTVVADSGVRTAGQAPVRLTADLTGGEELRLIATGPGGDGSAHADWLAPRLTCGPAGPNTPVAAPLGDRAQAYSSNGWGPVEIDRSNGEKAAGDGHALTVGGTVYTKGLGTNANSLVLYDLGGACTGLTVDVGVDDEVGGKGTVVFEIYADGQKVAASGSLTGNDGPVHLSAHLEGARALMLRVADGGDNTQYDHADWAAPQLTCL